VRRALGDAFGLTSFGVNLTRLAAGGMSALRHTHMREDEFIYILESEPVLVTNAGETSLRPGMCAGFKAGSGDAHHLLNRTEREVLYLEIGDRDPLFHTVCLTFATRRGGKPDRSRLCRGGSKIHKSKGRRRHRPRKAGMGEAQRECQPSPFGVECA
jgi:uncharacterized cupin superfamily protein